MTEKRFVYCFEGIEDKWETIEEDKYTPCTKDGFQDLCEMLNELHEENQQHKKELEECRNNKLFSRRELEKENKELKAFLKELADSQGNIYHRNGRVYNIKEVMCK